MSRSGFLISVSREWLVLSGPVCIATPSVSDDSPRTVVESVATGGSGSTAELVATTQPSLYDELRDTQTVSFALPFGTLLRRALPLGDVAVEDEIGTRPFGTSVDDFTCLSRSNLNSVLEHVFTYNCSRTREHRSS